MVESIPDWRWREATPGGKLHAFDRSWRHQRLRSACTKATTQRDGLKQGPATASASPLHRCKACSKTVEAQARTTTTRT